MWISGFSKKSTNVLIGIKIGNAICDGDNQLSCVFLLFFKYIFNENLPVSLMLSLFTYVPLFYVKLVDIA